MAGDMLKPLEALTRSLPPRPPSRPQWPSTGPPPPGATSEAQPTEEPPASAAQENGNATAPPAQPGAAPAAAGAPGPSQVRSQAQVLTRLLEIKGRPLSGPGHWGGLALANAMKGINVEEPPKMPRQTGRGARTAPPGNRAGLSNPAWVPPGMQTSQDLGPIVPDRPITAVVAADGALLYALHTKSVALLLPILLALKS